MKKTFQQIKFEFSYNDTWNASYSMIFTLQDTFYARQYFSSHRASNGDSNDKVNLSYTGILKKDFIVKRMYV
jgi:hypothetical protein